MQYTQRRSMWVMFVVLGLLVSCSQSAAVVPTPLAPTMTVVPSPTAEPTVAAGVSVNDVALSGKKLAQVTTALASLALPKRELIVLTGDITHTLTFTVALDQQATADAVLQATANTKVTKATKYIKTI